VQSGGEEPDSDGPHRRPDGGRGICRHLRDRRDRDAGRLRPGRTGGVHRVGWVRRGQSGGAEATDRGCWAPRVPGRSTVDGPEIVRW